jgi:hypothetical protein
MNSLWRRVPVVADWALAIVAGVVIYNLNVTSAGGPLSGAGLSAGPTSASITEAGRTTFYGALVVAGAVIAAAGLLVVALSAQRQAEGALLARTFAGLALAGIAGLLLDYRDGPVSWTQLAVYTIVVLSVLRFIRVGFMLNATADHARDIEPAT